MVPLFSAVHSYKIVGKSEGGVALNCGKFTTANGRGVKNNSWSAKINYMVQWVNLISILSFDFSREILHWSKQSNVDDAPRGIQAAAGQYGWPLIGMSTGLRTIFFLYCSPSGALDWRSEFIQPPEIYCKCWCSISSWRWWKFNMHNWYAVDSRTLYGNSILDMSNVIMWLLFLQIGFKRKASTINIQHINITLVWLANSRRCQVNVVHLNFDFGGRWYVRPSVWSCRELTMDNRRRERPLLDGGQIEDVGLLMI